MDSFVIALNDAVVVVGIATILLLGGLIVGWYTRFGSGIEPRPHSRRGTAAPGAEGSGEISGRDEGEGSAIDQEGVR
jgi:hypothetical protein